MPRRTALILILAVGGAIAYGILAYRLDLPPFRLDPALRSVSAANGEAPRRGRWHVASDSLAAPLTPRQREAMERLRSVGYLSGREPAPARVGVTRHEPDSVFAGHNLAVSGHGPEAWLFDMEGRVLHRWRKSFAEAFPDADVPGDTETPFYWRRVHLYPNGDLLAVFEGLGLVKLDRDSRVLWTLSRAVHHDVDVAADGTIYALVREPRILPRIHPRDPVLEDFVAVLDPGGRPLGAVSLLEAFERSPYAGLLEGMPMAGDLFHTNTLELMDGSRSGLSPLYRKGNALISLLTVSVIAVVDLESGEIAWADTGSFRAQHQPTLLPDGDILLFDNQGGPEGRSRVMEIEPATSRVRWVYGGTPATAFASYDCGSAARLPNGNTLITESSRGRAFEVTSSGRTVWEYYNPHRAGERKELIATLFEVIRLPADYVRPRFETPPPGDMP